MFVLAELKDTVRIPPVEFKQKLNDAITDELNRKLANKVKYYNLFKFYDIILLIKSKLLIYLLKVYLNVGLCIALHDITKIEESYIFPGDGASHTKVIFRYIVFRPFMEEILIGKIRSCSIDGVHGNIYIKYYYLYFNLYFVYH